MKNNKKLIEYSLIFIISFLLLSTNISNMDQIWNFGFSYNIANGLIPYVDYNMIVGPIFPVISALFIFLFKNPFLGFIFLGSLIHLIIFILMKKLLKKTYYLSFFLLLSNPIISYNIFSMLLLLLLLLLEKKKNKDYIIGLILGILIFTKINIGIFLCIPSLFIKDKSKLVKRILACELFTLLMLLIMKLWGNLSNFFNYTILGLFDFAEKNLIIDIWIIFPIISFIFVVYSYFYKKEKNIALIYLLCFQIMAYPIFDSYHSIISFIPVLGYIFDKIKLRIIFFRTSFYVLLTFILINNYLPISNNTITRNSKSILYKYCFEHNNVINCTKNITNYLNANNDYNLYIFSIYSYMLKIEAKIPINKYDLINYGNMGYMGNDIYLNEIKDNCNNNKCMFIIVRHEYKEKNQTSKELIKYAKSNKFKKSICSFDIYVND